MFKKIVRIVLSVLLVLFSLLVSRFSLLLLSSGVSEFNPSNLLVETDTCSQIALVIVGWSIYLSGALGIILTLISFFLWIKNHKDGKAVMKAKIFLMIAIVLNLILDFGLSSFMGYYYHNCIIVIQ